MPDRTPPPLNVGYLPLPRPLARFLRVAVPLILWCLVVAALVAARSQRDPGPAVWEDGTPHQFQGTLFSTPYPALLLDPGTGPTVALVVEQGKHGAARAAALDGQHVRCTGWPLHRDDRLIIELAPEPDAIRADESRAPAPPPVRLVRGRVTLAGEIVDSKCFLGAMKPGNGKTHKECATLCITGGIPPVLVSRNPGGALTYYLLLDPSGGPLDDAVFSLIGEPVTVSGELEEWAGTLRLRVAPGDVTRR